MMMEHLKDHVKVQLIKLMSEEIWTELIRWRMDNYHYYYNTSGLGHSSFVVLDFLQSISPLSLYVQKKHMQS